MGSFSKVEGVFEAIDNQAYWHPLNGPRYSSWQKDLQKNGQIKVTLVNNRNDAEIALRSKARSGGGFTSVSLEYPLSAEIENEEIELDSWLGSFYEEIHIESEVILKNSDSEILEAENTSKNSEVNGSVIVLGDYSETAGDYPITEQEFEDELEALRMVSNRLNQMYRMWEA